MMKTILTHYLADIVPLINILDHGFAWVPNKRHLIHDLVPTHDFREREPQEFGMVSFTDLTPSQAADHRAKFGKYGIVVSNEWANKHNAQKVLYVDRQGPVFDSLKWLFMQAYEKLKNDMRYPDDAGWQMAFSNRAMTGIAGAQLWGNLLTIYEYIELSENSYQSEWRVVNPSPLYGFGKTKKDIIDNVSPPLGWAQHIHVIKITPGDVAGFVCPATQKDEFASKLPEVFSSKEITTY